MALVNIKFKKPEKNKICLILIDKDLYKGCRVSATNGNMEFWKATKEHITDKEDSIVDYILMKDSHLWMYDI